MKRIIILMALTAIFALFAVPALAQTKECTEEFKSATYGKWYDNRQKDQPAAYEAAKEYLAVCTTEDAYSKALSKFVKDYDEQTAAVTNRKGFEEAVQKKNYADQMRFGKAILATQPDNAAVYIILGVAGLYDPTLLSESVPYAKRAIELVETGKPVTPLFTSKDQALAYLNYEIGKAVVKTNPADAIPYFLKTARYESELKKKPQIYLDLAGAYGEGPVTKLSEEYKAKNFTVETPESKLAMANINQAIDRQIDAFARAAALTNDAANKKAVMDVLTGLYMDRNNKSQAGLPELVATVLQKPLPDVPTPLTSLPTPPAPTAPATGSQPPGSTGVTQPGTTGSTKAAGGSGTGTAKPATNTGATGTGNGAAKPAATPTPGRKPRTNYRRPYYRRP